MYNVLQYKDGKKVKKKKPDKDKEEPGEKETKKKPKSVSKKKMGKITVIWAWDEVMYKYSVWWIKFIFFELSLPGSDAEDDDDDDEDDTPQKPTKKKITKESSPSVAKDKKSKAKGLLSCNRYSRRVVKRVTVRVYCILKHVWLHKCVVSSQVMYDVMNCIEVMTDSEQ